MTVEATKTTGVTKSKSDTVRRLIVETDLFSDVDDVGALAVAHALADLGEVELAAVSINTPSRFGAGAASVVNSYCGRPDIPIGVSPQVDDSLADREYARFLCETFPGAEQAPVGDAVPVLRRALSESADDSVILVSIGFFSNLVDLLESEPDAVSDLDGRTLIAKKVAQTVVMGGLFPNGTEFNIASHAHDARRFIAGWPQPVDFLGFEIGYDVITGVGFTADDAASSPIAAAYREYCGSAGRESWDLLAVELAVRGPREIYRFSEPGTVVVSEAGETTFEPQVDGKHRYVIREASAVEAGRSVDALMRAAGPKISEKG